MNGPMIDFDREKITNEISEAHRSLIKMEKVDFKERRATAQVCFELR